MDVAFLSGSKMSWDGQLRTVQFFLLMLSVFTVFIGYGIALPILPFLLENRFLDGADFSIAWHTGMMTAVFMFTLFIFAPLWGKLSDRIGRRPVILMGLGGCVVALIVFALVESLWLAYLTRALGGAVVSAVLPVALAYIGDTSSAKQRARRFAWMSAAATLGFLIGPVLGGWLSDASLASAMNISNIDSLSLPFLFAAAGGSLVWIAVYLSLSEPTALLSKLPVAPDNPPLAAKSINSLLLLALLGMFGLGSFEVGIALQGQQVLNLDPFQIGLLFMECSLMMVLVQVFLFARLVRYFSFTHIIVSSLLLMAAGLVLFPLAVDFVMVVLAVGLVGLGSGVLIPILAYQTSLNAGMSQGVALGKQTAAGSLGQGLGSVLAGGLFGVASQAPFWLTAGLLTAGAFAGLRFASLRFTSVWTKNQ